MPTTAAFNASALPATGSRVMLDPSQFPESELFGGIVVGFGACQRTDQVSPETLVIVQPTFINMTPVGRHYEPVRLTHPDSLVPMA